MCLGSKQKKPKFAPGLSSHEFVAFLMLVDGTLVGLRLIRPKVDLCRSEHGL